MEYTKKCNVCGKIFCYTDEDVRKNGSNSLMAGLTALGGLASLGGGTIFHTHHLQGQAERYSDKIVDFNQCPYCHSRDVSFCTKEEVAALEKKAAAAAVTINSGASAEALLKRAFIFLEDGDWASATAYSEACLDKDPELAEAYLAKLMAELEVRKRDSLRDQKKPFDQNSNYQKALRYADAQLKAELTDCIEHINTRNEVSRKNDIYARAQKAAETGEGSNYQTAVQLFASIPGWKDADAQLIACRKKLEEFNAAQARQAEIDREKAKLQAKKNKKTIIIVAIIAVICSALLFALISRSSNAKEDALRQALAGTSWKYSTSGAGWSTTKLMFTNGGKCTVKIQSREGETTKSYNYKIRASSNSAVLIVNGVQYSVEYSLNQNGTGQFKNFTDQNGHKYSSFNPY